MARGLEEANYDQEEPKMFLFVGLLDMTGIGEDSHLEDVRVAVAAMVHLDFVPMDAVG